MQARNRGISAMRPRMMLERQNRETGEQVDDSWLNDVGPRMPHISHMPLPSLSRRLNDIEDIATMPLSRMSKPPQEDTSSLSMERHGTEHRREQSVPPSMKGQKIAATDEGVFLPTLSRAEMMHLGPLAVLLKDERITEIVVLGPQRVVVKRDGTMHESIHHFTDEQQLLHTIEHLLHLAGQQIQANHPLAQACLADGTLVTVTMPPVSRTGPVLAIRKPTQSFQTLKELVHADMLSSAMADFLLACMQAQVNILVCGSTGAGKTTLLNALCATIPLHERIVSIENAAELRFSQPHVPTIVFFSSRPSHFCRRDYTHVSKPRAVYATG